MYKDKFKYVFTNVILLYPYVTFVIILKNSCFHSQIDNYLAGVQQ